MKIKSVIAELAVCAAVVAAVGCKKEEAAPLAPKTDQGTASTAAGVVDAAKSAAKEATDQATAQAKAAQDQAQGLIDKAKAYVSEQKYQDGLNTLGQLSNLKLTPEQQKLVDDLKAQIQTALAKASPADAASALGGALGGKK